MAQQAELVQCPFDPIHFIERHRLPGHIVRCKKNYTGPPLELCMFNAMHMVKSTEMAEHLRSCPDALVALRDRERVRQDESYREQIESRANSLNQSIASRASTGRSNRRH